MNCDQSDESVEPEMVRPGILRCPVCGKLLDEETLDELPEEG